MRPLIFAGALAAAVAACYGSGGAGKSAGAPRTLLLADEIQASAVSGSAYDAVRRLRPEFLRNRGARSLGDARPEPLVVYLNGVMAGGVEALNQIPATDVRSIRYLNGRDATTRYGTGHGGGVLEVATGN